jgi:DNA-binding NtrC family response regulator
MENERQGNIRKVMILEDEDDILLLYKDYLKRKGHYIIASSTTADEALKDYEKYVPDVVIIDYKLPGKKNGLEAAREIVTKDPRARILIISAFEKVKQEIAQTNFFRDKQIPVLIKPIKLSRLGEIISKF